MGARAWLVTWWPALCAVVLALGLVAFSGYAQWAAGDGIFIDWLAYAYGSERVLRGESLYLPEQLAGPYHLPDVTPSGYIYPPPSAVLFMPFALGYAGLAAWLLVNAALFMSGLVAVVRREMGVLRPVPLALVFLGLFFLLPVPGHIVAPWANGVVNANVNVALAGLAAWCWASGAGARWIPYVAGVAAIIKIFPGALALWAARRHGLRPVLLATLVAAALALATLPLVGVDDWRAFLTALDNAQPTCDGGRISVACITQPFLGSAGGTLAGIVVGGALVAASLVVRAEYPAFVLLVLGMILPVADGHQHYFLFVYVLAVIGASRHAARRGAGRRDPADVPAAPQADDDRRRPVG